MSNWWDDLEPWAERAEDGDYAGIATYTVDATIRANHNILAGIRNNDFDVNDPSYSRGLVLVGGLFLLAGLLACVLLRCVVSYTAKRKTALSERLLQTRDIHATRGKSLLVLALTAVAALVWVVKSLFEVEVRMNKIEGSTEEIVDSLLRGFTLPKRVLTSLLGVLSSYLRAQVGFDSCFYLDHDADEPVEQLEEGVKENMHILKEAGLDELADGVDDVSFKILQMRDIRHRAVWPTIGLCVLLLAFYLYLGARECRSSGSRGAAVALEDGDGDDDDDNVDVRGKRRRCCDRRGGCCLRLVTFLLAFLVWMTAAGSVTLSALSGDFCSDLGSSVESVVEDGNNSTLLAPLVEHYTGDCSQNLANLAVASIGAAQDVAEATMGVALDILTAAAKLCSEASDDVQLMDASMKTLWDSLDEAAEVVSCPKINGLYRSAVWDDLCAELPGWLISLLVSCMTLSALLLLLWVHWSLLLRRWREEDGVELGTIPFGYGDKPHAKAAGITGTAAYVSEYGTAAYVSDFGQAEHFPIRSPSSSGAAAPAGGDFDLMPDILEAVR